MRERDTWLRQYIQSMAEMGQRCAQSNGSPSIKAGWKYSTQDEFYLKEGHIFSSDPLTEVDREIIRKLPRFRFKVKECYKNAGLIIMDGSGLGFKWCEGIAVGKAPIPVPHAWVSLFGKPIDVTWRIDDQDRPTRSIDKLLVRIDYNILHGSYWGIEVPENVLTDHLLQAKRYSPVVEGPNYRFDLLRTGPTWRKEYG